MYFYSGHHGAGQLVNRHSRTDALFRLPALLSRRRRLRLRRRRRRARGCRRLGCFPLVPSLELPSGDRDDKRARRPFALSPKRASTVNTIF